MISEARVPTDKADRYANRLCKHFAHKIHAEWTPPEGVAEFPNLGTCQLTARSDELVLRIEAVDAEKMGKVQYIVGDHLERFGKREGLSADWRPVDEPRS